MIKIVLLALAMSATACTPAKVAKEDKPPIDMYALEPLPEPVKGNSFPAAPDEATDEDKACMGRLGIPEDAIVIEEKQAMAAIKLRLYAQQLHSDATYNVGICNLWGDAMWKQMARAQEYIDENEAHKRTWWYRNKDVVIFGSGFTIGTAVTVLVVYGVSKAME